MAEATPAVAHHEAIVGPLLSIPISQRWSAPEDQQRFRVGA